MLAFLCASSLAQCSNSESLVNITDETGNEVAVPLNPQRIVCMSPAAAEIIYALGESDRLVGLTEDCNMPPVLQEKKSVGKSCRSADIEMTLELRPDLVITKTGGQFSVESEEQIKAGGVPVVRYRALHIDTLIPMIEDIGLILGKEDAAEELKEYEENYCDTISERVMTIPTENRPSVYFMSMGHFDWTASSVSAGHKRIVESGGNNIAADLNGKVPHVDMEWVIDQNPDIIVYSISSSQYGGATPTIEEMKQKRQEIFDLPGFDQINAVKNNKVYVMDISMASGLNDIVTLLYYAKWFNPGLFQDVDPRAVQEDIYQRYFDINLDGIRQVYPEN
ncbi:MAG: ABC transporter substrate-binding protein [Methanotrichaceae archaeon]